MLVELQPGEVHGVLLPCLKGGKGALLTALAYSVRSGAIRPSVRPVYRYPKRAEGGTHRPCAKCLERTGATQREMAIHLTT